MSEQATCELCGQPMPPGEEMFKFHGYSGPCPVPPKLIDHKTAKYREPVAAPANYDPLVPHIERGGNGGDVLLSVGGKTYRIPADHWVSDIANASYYGEDGYGFYRAWEFHGKRPVGPTMPLSDKSVPDNF